MLTNFPAAPFRLLPDGRLARSVTPVIHLEETADEELPHLRARIQVLEHEQGLLRNQVAALVGMVTSLKVHIDSLTAIV